MKSFVSFLSKFINRKNDLSRPILNTARHNMLKVKAQFSAALKPSIRWERNLNSIKNFINKCPNAVEAIRFAQVPSCSGFDHRGAIDPHSEWVQKNFKALLDAHPAFSDAILQLEDSPANCPELSAVHQGKIITNTLFFAANYIFECLKYIQPKVVCEIGGGYGSPAYVWLSNKVHNPNVYIDIDYPECLFFAEVYLKSSLPHANFIYIDSIKKAKSLQSLLNNGKQNIILCPVQFADYIKNFDLDLVTNVGSLQEMEETAVDFWMSWIEDSKSNCFFSCNYFSQPLDNLAQSTNLYAPRLSKKWDCIKKLDYEMPLFILHTVHEFAYIFAKRTYIDAEAIDVKESCYYKELQIKATWSRKDFQEIMDIIRVTQNKKIALNFLSRLMEMGGITYFDSNSIFASKASAVPYIPKESLYVAEWLYGDKQSLPESEVSGLEKIKAELSHIYEGSIKGTM